MAAIEKSIARKIGKAIFDYKMIKEGDKILIAVSGGKDSITMLKDLAARQKNFPFKYEIVAAHISADFSTSPTKEHIEGILKNSGVPYHIFPVQVEGRLKPGRKMNCYWCSTQRRLELMKFAESIGCNKIALGHHLDDIAETLLMNMMYKGVTGGMLPVMPYKKFKCTIIRPLAYLKEDEIITYVQSLGLTGSVCTCALGTKSKRREVREIIRKLSATNPNIQENLLKSMHNVDMEYLIGFKTEHTLQIED